MANRSNYRGFYKVNESGYSLTSATFYNPDTNEKFTKIVWDNDDDRLLYDKELQILRFLPINEEIKKMYLHSIGILQVGDVIEVYKGRKVPKGTVAKITDIKPYYDRYGRNQCDYAYLDNGMKTNIENCKLYIAL